MKTDEPITWSVELPQKNAALGQRRPRARLLIGESEAIPIPKAVGAKLKRLEDDTRFGSRAELLFSLKEISNSCAHARMEQLVNFREYSSAELTQKLLDDGYLPSLVEDIVSRAQEVGIINDARFCESFIRSKVIAGWGKLRIQRELERRGVTQDTIQDFDDLFPQAEVEAERAYELARRRTVSGKNDYQKIIRHLVSRGFALSVASVAARRVLDELKEAY